VHVRRSSIGGGTVKATTPAGFAVARLPAWF